MAAQVWPINIVAGASHASFVPDVYVPPGKPVPTSLQAKLGDAVSWYNDTNDEHQIWQSGTTPVQLTDPIAPHTSSFPAYIVALPGTATTGTINYYCSKHAAETGAIDVV